jgi:peptide/nickel transport system permease protein
LPQVDYFNSFKNIISRLLSDKLSAAALLILLGYLIAALCVECYGFYCAKTDRSPIYNQGDIDNRYKPPSASNWMGTDYQGRDVFWRAVAGSSTAIKVGAMASLLSALIGVALGATAGYFGGWVDDFVVWIYSSFASMPTLLFILAFALLVSKGFLFPPIANFLNSIADTFNSDPGMLAIYLGIGLTGWVSLCRVVRGETMRLRELAYVQAAKAMGFSSAKIILKHIIPNLFHLVIIYFTMRFAYAIMTEVIVSYLGLGVEMAPSWGVMIADGQERLWRGIWWEVAAATGFMFFLVLSLHVLGDSLRDILDPRLKN